ncbi:MAG: dihydropteroate synthase [Candidatus Omnitrophota bacterium]
MIFTPKAQSISTQRTFKRKRFIVQARHHRLILGSTTKIMGILNITPDSFSQDGCLYHSRSVDQIVAKAHRMIREGADMIDVGGESTRPGAKQISAQEEIRRIIPVIKKLSRLIKKPISVDTYKERVAREALEAGASIVNDILGVALNKKLLRMVKNYKAAIILMHMRGTPRTMQKNIHYKNLINEIYGELVKSIEKCLEIGIQSDRIIIDPGIGFGKTVEHNCEIIQRLQEFGYLNFPLLIGTSRKSFIGKVLKREVNERLMGTAATITAAIMNGAHIVRVHDVREIKDVAHMTDAIINQRGNNS